MATNYLQGVKPASDSVSDAYAKAATIAMSIGSGFLNRDVEAYKLDQAAKQLEIENKRADAMLAIQQNQEKRAVDALAKTDRTQAALVDYSNVLNNYSKDVVNEEQGRKLAELYARNPKADIQGQVNKMQAVYNDTPEAKSAMLSRVGAMPTSYEGQSIDPSAMLAEKNRAFGEIEDQLKTKKQNQFTAGQTDKQIRASAALQRNSQNFELRKANLIENKENKVKKDTLAALMPMLPVEMQAELKRDAARGVAVDVLLAKGKVSQEAHKAEKDAFKKITTKSIGDDLRAKYLGKVNPDTLTNALTFLNNPKFQKSFFNRINTLEGKRNVWDKLDRVLLDELQNNNFYTPSAYNDYETDDYGNMFTWNGITANELMKKQK
jgi:hypothetical protein